VAALPVLITARRDRSSAINASWFAAGVVGRRIGASSTPCQRCDSTDHLGVRSPGQCGVGAGGRVADPLGRRARDAGGVTPTLGTDPPIAVTGHHGAEAEEDRLRTPARRSGTGLRDALLTLGGPLAARVRLSSGCGRRHRCRADRGGRLCRNRRPDRVAAADALVARPGCASVRVVGDPGGRRSWWDGSGLWAMAFPG
jgi:hypothetical protein